MRIFVFSFVISSSKSEEEKRSNKVTEEAVAERLKPPPDQINFQRKVIKISDSAKRRITNELDKIVIKNKKNNVAISEEPSTVKRLCPTVEANGKQDKEPKNSGPSTVAVKLKRNSLDINVSAIRFINTFRF